MADQTNRASTTIIYKGSDVAEGLMDVKDLAPALLALGNLCQATNRCLNGDEAKVDVLVRSDFKAGSFEVSLELVQACAST